jgi:hypothetical protein
VSVLTSVDDVVLPKSINVAIDKAFSQRKLKQPSNFVAGKGQLGYSLMQTVIKQLIKQYLLPGVIQEKQPEPAYSICQSFVKQVFPNADYKSKTGVKLNYLFRTKFCGNSRWESLMSTSPNPWVFGGQTTRRAEQPPSKDSAKKRGHGKKRKKASSDHDDVDPGPDADLGAAGDHGPVKLEHSTTDLTLGDTESELDLTLDSDPNVESDDEPLAVPIATAPKKSKAAAKEKPKAAAKKKPKAAAKEKPNAAAKKKPQAAAKKKPQAAAKKKPQAAAKEKPKAAAKKKPKAAAKKKDTPPATQKKKPPATQKGKPALGCIYWIQGQSSTGAKEWWMGKVMSVGKTEASLWWLEAESKNNPAGPWVHSIDACKRTPLMDRYDLSSLSFCKEVEFDNYDVESMTLTGCNYSATAAEGFWDPESPSARGPAESDDDDDDFDGDNANPSTDSGSDVDADRRPTDWTTFFYDSMYALAHAPNAKKKWSKMQDEAKELNNALSMLIIPKTETAEVERLAKQLLNTSAMYADLKQLGRLSTAAEIKRRKTTGRGFFSSSSSSSSVSEPAATVSPPAVPSAPIATPSLPSEPAATVSPPAVLSAPIATPSLPSEPAATVSPPAVPSAPIATPSLPSEPAATLTPPAVLSAPIATPSPAVPETPPRPLVSRFGVSPRYFATSASNSLSPQTSPINCDGSSPDPNSPCSA